MNRTMKSAAALLAAAAVVPAGAAQARPADAPTQAALAETSRIGPNRTIDVEGVLVLGGAAMLLSAAGLSISRRPSYSPAQPSR